MKQLLSLNSYHYRRGGSDVVYLDHAALFEDIGWQNTFFSMHHPCNLETADSYHFAKLVDFEFADTPFKKIRTAISSVYNFDAKARARELVASNRFDIAHAHCVYHHLTPAVFEVLHDARIPIVLTAHDLKLACPAYKMMHSKGICEDCKGGDLINVVRNRCIKNSVSASAVVAFEAWLHRALGSYRKHLAKIVAPSQFYRDKLIEWGIEEERVVYVPNFTRQIDPTSIGDYSRPIIYFGRLSEEKGLGTLVEAAALSGIPVEIVGSGPIEARLHAQADDCDAPVTFRGRLDGDELWAAIGRARAVVIPSEWYENAPMSVLEAFQLKRPVIGANIGGIPELVMPDMGACGLLFESGNAGDLARTLEKVSQLNSIELSALGNRGRELALGRFSKESYASAFSELYADLMAKG